MSRLIVLFFIMLLLTLSLGQHRGPALAKYVEHAPPQEELYKEQNYYYDGAKWTASWLQCDLPREVLVFETVSDSPIEKLLRITNSAPNRKREIKLSSSDEPDCGMMKCRYSLTAVDPDRGSYLIQESHYLDREGGYWTNQYQVGTGATAESAESRLTQCRWFPRLRVAAIAISQSFYVTETKSGGLLLRVFAFRQPGNQPSVAIANGAATFDKKKSIETFTFNGKERQFVIRVNTAESDPRIEVSAGHGATRPVDAISYTYVKKN